MKSQLAVKVGIGLFVTVAIGAVFVPRIIESIQHPTAKTTMAKATAGSTDAGRFNVTLVAKFYDSLAYDEQRGIYLITDKKTGKEMVGISGVGISELGSHSERNGDHTTTVADER